MKKHNRWYYGLVTLSLALLIGLTAGCGPAPAPTPATITLTAPQEGDVLTAGSTQTIAWYAEGTEFDHVCLVYSMDNWATWEFIDESYLKNGTYDWQVPDTLSGRCWIAANIFTHADEWLVGDEAVVFIEPAAGATALPIINFFTSTPASITPGNDSELLWDVDNAEHVTISGVGAVPNKADLHVFPSVTTTYTLTATNAAGSVTESVTVTVGGAPPTGLPVINYFAANPTSIKPGDSSTLTWDVDNATTVTISQVGTVSPKGWDSVSLTTTTNYTLTATNAVGSATKMVTVTVGGAPPTGLPVINSFAANPTGIKPGDSSTLTWHVDNANTVTISQGVGAVPSGGSNLVSLTVTTTYTLTATNAAGIVTESVTVTVWYRLILSLESSESGTIFSNGTVFHEFEDPIGVGDTFFDNYAYGFVSFDITGLASYNVKLAELTFQEDITEGRGDPNTFADGLMLYEADWGPRALQSGDFQSYKWHIGALGMPAGQPQSLEVTTFVRAQVNGGAQRFQVKIGFYANVPHGLIPAFTDNDGQWDMVSLRAFFIDVYYTTT